MKGGENMKWTTRFVRNNKYAIGVQRARMAREFWKHK